MNYRDDLIRRLQDEGLWDHFTAEQQERFRKLTDEQARQMMVVDDQWELGDQQAIELFGLMSLCEVNVLFEGALVEHRRGQLGRLSKAGRRLAEFFTELHEQGLPADRVDAGLQRLSPLVIAALTTVYRRQSE